MQLYCDTMEQFNKKFASDIPGVRIDCKKFLEETFNIKL